MKLLLRGFGAAVMVGMFSLIACNNNSESSSAPPSDTGMGGTVDSASPKTDTLKMDSAAANRITNTSPDQATIDYLVPGNKKEIAWLMAAEKNGTDKDLKVHAKMMLTDHKKLGEDVARVMEGKNLSAPPVDTVGIVNLTEPKGKEWDKAWLDKMVKEHQDLIEKLKQSEKEVMDSSLKNLVKDTRPVVESHLMMVKSVQAKMK